MYACRSRTPSAGITATWPEDLRSCTSERRGLPSSKAPSPTCGPAGSRVPQQGLPCKSNGNYSTFPKRLLPCLCDLRLTFRCEARSQLRDVTPSPPKHEGPKVLERQTLMRRRLLQSVRKQDALACGRKTQASTCTAKNQETETEMHRLREQIDPS